MKSNLSEDELACGCCGAEVPYPRHHTLERCILTIRLEREASESSRKFSQIGKGTNSEIVHKYCNRKCWERSVEKMVSLLALKYPWPSDVGLIGICSRCGGMLNRTTPHVVYLIQDETHIRKPWVIEIHVNHGMIFAHLCRNCAPSLSSTEEALSKDEGIPVTCELFSSQIDR